MTLIHFSALLEQNISNPIDLQTFENILFKNQEEKFDNLINSLARKSCIIVEEFR